MAIQDARWSVEVCGVVISQDLEHDTVYVSTGSEDNLVRDLSLEEARELLMRALGQLAPVGSASMSGAEQLALELCARHMDNSIIAHRQLRRVMECRETQGHRDAPAAAPPVRSFRDWGRQDILDATDDDLDVWLFSVGGDIAIPGDWTAKRKRALRRWEELNGPRDRHPGAACGAPEKDSIL